MDNPLILALVAGAFLLAGFVKGVIGLGLPTVAIGLLGIVMAPAQAAALLVIPSLVTNIWQLAAGPNFVGLIRRLWPMLICLTLGTLAGVGLLTGDISRTTIALGAVLFLYALLGLAAVRFAVPPRAEPFLSPIVGGITGVITSATGLMVIPGVPYLQALGLPKDDLVQALGLSFTVSTIALGALLLHDGAFGTSLSGAPIGVTSAAAIVPAVIGMMLGQRVRAIVRPEVFRMWFFCGMLVLGAHLALRAFY